MTLISMNHTGLILSEIFFLMIFVLSFGILQRAKLAYPSIIALVCLSAFLFVIGTIAYWKYGLTHATDAQGYFIQAHVAFIGVETYFVESLTTWLRAFISGDSFLGTQFVFSSMSFLGGIFYVCLLRALILRVIPQEEMKKIPFIFCAALLLCWPSSVFFTACSGKDALLRFLIPLFFLSFSFRNAHPVWFIFRGILLVSIFCVRPYMAVIIVAAAVCTFFLFSHQKFSRKVIWLLVIFVILAVMLYFIKPVYRIHSYSLYAIGARAVQQQYAQAMGEFFPPATSNPYLVFLYLPRAMLFNWLLPLFSFSNMRNALSSLENMTLACITMVTLLKCRLWYRLQRWHIIFAFLLCYIVVGMALLGLVNTNLGSAMRQKLMYTPIIILFFGVLIQVRWRARST